jgi:hypothetical protein
MGGHVTVDEKRLLLFEIEMDTPRAWREAESADHVVLFNPPSGTPLPDPTIQARFGERFTRTLT